MIAFIQNLLSGVALGSVYGLVALGYTMVYGVLQFINFAHSDLFMAGVFVALGLSSWLVLVGCPPWIAFFLVLLLTAVFCILLALGIERVAYRPMRHSPRINVLIVAIGLSLFMENYGQVILGADPRLFPALLPTYNLLPGTKLVFTNIQFLTFVFGVVFTVALYWVVHRTRLGIAMRAVSNDSVTARLLGVASERIVAWAFGLGAAMAGFAALLYGLNYPKTEPLLGVIIGLKAFSAAVVGGIGSISGAMLGGIVLGVAETLVAFYGSSNMRDAIAFGLLIFILLIRPSGLLGRAELTKV